MTFTRNILYYINHGKNKLRKINCPRFENETKNKISVQRSSRDMHPVPPQRMSRCGSSRRRAALIVVSVIAMNAVALLYVTIAEDGNALRHFYDDRGRDGWRSRLAATAGCVRMPALDAAEVPVNRSVFFVETNRRPAVSLTVRKACSVESAARVHPDRLVYVLSLSPELGCGKNADVAAAFSLVTNYPNVRLRHIDLDAYTRDTPIEEFVRSGVMESGRWPTEQHSDMLRLLTLWKFGGTYVDLDVVSLRPMPLIDFVGAEYPGDELLASAVIGMQNKDVAEKAIRMFQEGWNGESWVQNGPYLLTRLMRDLCGTDNVTSMYSGNTDCNGFTVFPPETFGPIAWYDWTEFFDPSKVEQVREKIKNSMAVHFWNKMTREQAVVPASRHPYAEIAKEYCPIVFGTVVDHF